MAYNRNLVTSTRSVRDSQKKQEYRRGKFDNLPRVQPNQFTNGCFRIRLLPEESKKNPHGFLDYRVHKVPQNRLISGHDPRFIKMQCPRSSNWDPTVFNPQTGEEYQNVRCAVCELDEYVFGTPWDPDDPEGSLIIDNLPDGLKEVIGQLDFRSNSWDSGIYIPCIIQAKVHTHTKEADSNDPNKFWDRYTYGPGGTEDFLPCLLKLRHPDFSERFDENGFPMQAKNGLQEQFFNFVDQCPDASDLQFGRWVTITKVNDGTGVGGYSFAAEPYPSPFAADKVEDAYKKLYGFPQWGDKTKKKPSTRLPYEQQISILANCEWADDLRMYDVPITDSDVDILDAGGTLVPEQPQTYTPTAHISGPQYVLTQQGLPAGHGHVPFQHPPQYVPGNPPAQAYASPPATYAATSSPFNQPPIGNSHFINPATGYPF